MSDTTKPVPNEKTASTEVQIDASPSAVWEALTTDHGLERWMGDGARIDACPDGELDVPDVVGGRPRQGRITRVVPERHLAFEWWPVDDPDDRSDVEIGLEPIGPGTTVTVIEVAPRLRVVGATGAWAWRGATLALSTNMCHR